MRFTCDYLSGPLFNLSDVIEQAALDLENVTFDTFVGTGFSGSLVIPALALWMDKSFVLIRKDTDDSHHGAGRLIGDLGQRWIFVDDFVCSGATRRRVMDKINDAVSRENRDRANLWDTAPETPTFIGDYLYAARYGAPRFRPLGYDPTIEFV